MTLQIAVFDTRSPTPALVVRVPDAANTKGIVAVYLLNSVIAIELTGWTQACACRSRCSTRRPRAAMVELHT